MSGFAVVQSESRTPTIKHPKINNPRACAHNALTHDFFIRDFRGHVSESANSCLAYVIFRLDFPSLLLVSPRLYFASNSVCPLPPYRRGRAIHARRPRPCAVLSCTVSFPFPPAESLPLHVTDRRKLLPLRITINSQLLKGTHVSCYF